MHLCDAVIVKNDKTWSTELKFQENITEKLHVVRRGETSVSERGHDAPAHRSRG